MSSRHGGKRTVGKESTKGTLAETAKDEQAWESGNSSRMPQAAGGLKDSEVDQNKAASTRI